MELLEVSSAEHKLASAQEGSRVEHQLEFANCRIIVRQYEWRDAHADIWKSDHYFIHMNLNGRGVRAHATYLDIDRQVPEDVGRVMVVPPGRWVHSWGQSGRQRSLVVALAPPLVDDLLQHQPNWHRSVLADALHVDSPEVEWFLLKMYHELRQPGFGTLNMMASLADGLAVALIRALKLAQVDAPRTRGGLPPWRMRLIRDRIHADRPPPQLAELAALCGMSVRHLSRAFKDEMGMTVAKYASNVMVERATRMLGDASLPVSEIASRLGFSSSASFAYAFRRVSGFRPNELRL